MSLETVVERKVNMRGGAIFIVMSLIGILAFFYNFKIGEQETFLVNHMATFIRTQFSVFMPYFVVLMGVVGMSDLYIRRAKFFHDRTNTFMSIAKIIGFIMILLVIFDAGPALLMKASIGPTILAKILIPISVTVIVAALFLPFLLDYGLVDACGVLMRPIMRPLFKAPGLSSVIAVSAFLGNFSIGHIATDALYKEGRLTQKEAVIIGTGFCTVSVAFLMVIASTLGILEYWNFYFWSAFFITVAVTAVQVRIWPTNKKLDECSPGVTAIPEKVFKTAIFKNAFYEGVDIAAKQTSLLKREKIIMRDSVLILAGFISTVMFFSVLTIVIVEYTMILDYVGYIFYPFLWLVQVPIADLAIAGKACAISYLEVTLTAIIGTSGPELSLHTKYILGVVPISAIVFLAAFVPCIMSTTIPVKLGELSVIWLQRVILTILFAGVVGLLYF